MDTTRHDKVFKTSSPRTGRELDAMAGGGGGIVVGGSSGSGGGGVRYHSELLGVVNSSNYLDTETAIHLTAEKLAEINSFYDKFLRKDTPDTAAEPITFKKGITVTGGAATDTLYVEKGATAGSLYVEETSSTRDLVVRRLAEILQLNVTEVATLARAIVKEFVSSETFIPGFAGEGFKIWQIAAGEWHGEIDSLTIRRSLNAFELLIQKYRAINGGLVISQGAGKIKSVTEDATHYLLEMEGDLTILPDDFIRCQTWGTGEVEEYKFDFTDSSKWRTNLFDAPWLVSEYTNNLYRVNSISNSEESYFLLGYDLNGGESIDISLKISGLEEGDRLVVATGSTNNQIAQEITSVGTYTFNYLNDNNDGRIDTFVIIYQTTSVGTKNLLIEQVPEKKIETVTNKFYWVRVDGIENGMVKVLKSEFDDGNHQPVAYPYDFTDSSKWQVPTTTGDIAIDYTNHSCRFTGVTLKDATYILFFYNKLKPGESINISLKITGLGEGGTLMVPTGTQENPTVQNINSDGTYTFEFLNDSVEDAAWLIGYQETVAGEKNILIEQIPEQPGFNSAWMFDANNPNVTHTLTSIHLIAAREELEPITIREIPPGESIRLNLQVTGLTEGQEIRVVGANSDEQKPTIISQDGTYKVEYSNTRPDATDIFGIGYKGAIGPCDITVSIVPDSTNIPATGDEVVQMGNATDVTRQALILLSATDGKPCIDLLAGVNSKSFAGKLQMRAGCLDGIQDPDFPTDLQPSGYGLYCSNAFLKGSLVLRNGKSVDAEIEEVRTELTAIPGQITAAVSSVKEYTDSSVGGVREELNTNLSAIPGQIELSVSSAFGAVKFGTRNYVLNSRMNRTDNCRLFGGTVNLVTDEKFGTVVEYSRPDGGGEYQFTWELSNTAELNNTDIVFSVIAKRMTESGDWNFGGWNTTFDLCRTFDANQIDLGGGWIQYWATAKKEYIRGPGNSGTFGINSVSGTWRFYAVGVYKGNKPVDWTAAPEDLESRVSQAELNLQPDNIWLGISNKMSTAVLPRTKQTVDATGLDQSTYYPVTISLSTTEPYTITVHRSLWADYGVPSWSTHSGGFSVVCRWTSNGAGWGTIAIMRTVHEFRYSHCNALPVGSISQMTNGSREVIWVRGGSKYDIMVEGTPTADIWLHPTTFTEYNQSASPTTSVVAPEPNWDALTRTGINIDTKEITINAETTKIVSNGQVAALFTTDANGNPIIQGRFLKLSDGAEIAGFVVDGRKLCNADGTSIIEIGSESRFTRISSANNSVNISASTESNVYPCASFDSPNNGIALRLHGALEGLALKIEPVFNDGEVSQDTVYALAYGPVIKLPAGTLRAYGRCIFVRNLHTDWVTIFGNFNVIRQGTNNLYEVRLNREEVFMFVWYNRTWYLNYISY